MKVHFSPLAQNDIQSIGEYLETRNPQGARRVLAAIRRTVKFVADFPLGARAAAHRDLRVVVVREYPYNVFYRTHRDFIEIVHIRHAARRPWPGADETT